MTPYEQKKLDMEFKAHLSRNFEKPSNCKNLDQLRKYIDELCSKIEEFRKEYDYVPGTAYWHLTQYNERQILLLEQQVKQVP